MLHWEWISVNVLTFFFCDKWEHIRCCRLANKTANNVEMNRVEWQSGQKVMHSQVRHTQTSSSPVSPAACKHTPETTPESSASSLPPTCLPEDRQHEQSTVTLEMKRSKKTEREIITSKLKSDWVVKWVFQKAVYIFPAFTGTVCCLPLQHRWRYSVTRIFENQETTWMM